MYVGKKRPVPADSFIGTRTKKTIEYAIKRIQESPLCPYVRSLLLYGSCARKEQRIESDVDLHATIGEEWRNSKLLYHKLILKEGEEVWPTATTLITISLCREMERD